LSYRRLLWMTSTRVVQEMLGHANIRQTMDTYSHVLPNMQQAAERMDAMLG
jgi:integrase